MSEIFRAVWCGDLELLKRLVNGQNLNAIDDQDGTLLYAAVESNRLNIVDWLIRKGADLNITAPNLYTPLVKAIAHNKLGVVKLLISAGCDVNITDSTDHWSPLYTAVILNNQMPTYVRILVDHGATLITNEHSENPQSKLTQIERIITTRLETRYQAIAFLTLHKQKQGPSYFTKQDKYIARLISKHIWSARLL
jgi:ankyrin repeat protein